MFFFLLITLFWTTSAHIHKSPSTSPEKPGCPSIYIIQAGVCNFRISNKTALSLLVWITAQQETKEDCCPQDQEAEQVNFIYFSLFFFLSLYHRDFADFHNLSFVQLNTKKMHLAPSPDLFAGVLWKQTQRSALPNMPLLHRIPVLRDHWVPNSHISQDLCLLPLRWQCSSLFPWQIFLTN